MRVDQKAFDTLKEYALWYYFKYLCSQKRLFQKVFSKSGKNQELTQQVLEEMSRFIDEEKNVEARVRFCIERNKNISYIKGNLISKGYEKGIVESCITAQLEAKWGSLLDGESIARKIISYKQKGKSKKYIIQKLLEREGDRDIVLSQIEEIFSEGESDNLKKEYQKLQGKFEAKKIIEKLLRKGFSYDEVKKMISVPASE